MPGCNLYLYWIMFDLFHIKHRPMYIATTHQFFHMNVGTICMHTVHIKLPAWKNCPWEIKDTSIYMNFILYPRFSNFPCWQQEPTESHFIWHSSTCLIKGVNRCLSHIKIQISHKPPVHLYSQKYTLFRISTSPKCTYSTELWLFRMILAVAFKNYIRYFAWAKS